MLRTITGPILDSSGQPANGWLFIRASRPFDVAEGHITQAQTTVIVQGGVPRVIDAPWQLPITPDGVFIKVVQDLDGEAMQRFNVVVPDGDAPITYSALLSNRGGVGSGWSAYVWDLTGGIDFPPEALIGDLGIDLVSGELWRNEP